MIAGIIPLNWFQREMGKLAQNQAVDRPPSTGYGCRLQPDLELEAIVWYNAVGSMKFDLGGSGEQTQGTISHTLAREHLFA
jgi:hypothetical protein